MSGKVENYYRRGQRALTIEEVQRVFAEHPFLPRPKHIIILDGDVVTNEGTAVGLTPSGESVMILTPLSDEDTVVHEAIHQFGFGEFMTQLLAPIIERRRARIVQRIPQYQICNSCNTHKILFEKYGIVPERIYPPPNIRHYILLNQ
jgi:hypothetical protein